MNSMRPFSIYNCICSEHIISYIRSSTVALDVCNYCCKRKAFGQLACKLSGMCVCVCARSLTYIAP